MVCAVGELPRRLLYRGFFVALTQKLLLGYHAKDLKEVVRKYYVRHHHKS